ncbi:MurR/RpiR family transcriptional regulator [Paenibacillus sp. JJ-223]|uniref:MurR/RpiR family transcriptional regulator n=1 Tax=Paenibacillus sp. JJ-223 TaxID=2905647 RepID=UPI001F20299D|nr:MurR/RpiR family transcriptional regulator [Paenibacillus sp. JJ-223]CAH1210274.1 HTH-type transcriptional regulator MurR [Paenibacillus sp. JJ-223]
MKLLHQLKQMNDFTVNEQSIASYILRHQESCLSLSVQELAQATFTSHSTVVRLTQKLGLTGFKEFKIKLARELQDNLHQINSIDANMPFQLYESPIQISKDIAELMKETIDRTFAMLDGELLNRSALLLHKAKRILIFALGDSLIRAKSFQNRMYKINQYVVIATEVSDWAYHMVNMTSEDCAIFLTYHNKSPIFLKAARHFRHIRMPTVTITASIQSELARLSTICIQVPNDEVHHAKIGTFSSQIALEYALNALYSCIYQINYANHKQAMLDSVAIFRSFDMMNDV